MRLLLSQEAGHTVPGELRLQLEKEIIGSGERESSTTASLKQSLAPPICLCAGSVSKASLQHS